MGIAKEVVVPVPVEKFETQAIERVVQRPVRIEREVACEVPQVRTHEIIKEVAPPERCIERIVEQPRVVERIVEQPRVMECVERIVEQPRVVERICEQPRVMEYAERN